MNDLQAIAARLKRDITYINVISAHLFNVLLYSLTIPVKPTVLSKITTSKRELS